LIETQETLLVCMPVFNVSELFTLKQESHAIAVRTARHVAVNFDMYRANKNLT